MANRHERSFNFQKKRFGQIFGQPFEVLCVDYADLDQTPNTKYDQRMYKAEVVIGKKYIQTPLPDGSYYCLHGAYDSIVTGEILKPLRSDTTTPILTVLDKSPMEEMCGIRTNRLCDIYNGEDPIFQGCYFEYGINVNSPMESFHKFLNKLSPSQKVPDCQILMYHRVLRTVARDIEGLLIKDLSQEVPITWRIDEATTVGKLMLISASMSIVE